MEKNWKKTSVSLFPGRPNPGASVSPEPGPPSPPAARPQSRCPRTPGLPRNFKFRFRTEPKVRARVSTRRPAPGNADCGLGRHTRVPDSQASRAGLPVRPRASQFKPPSQTFEPDLRVGLPSRVCESDRLPVPESDRLQIRAAGSGWDAARVRVGWCRSATAGAAAVSESDRLPGRAADWKWDGWVRVGWCHGWG